MKLTNKLHSPGFNVLDRAGKSFMSSLIRILNIQVLIMCSSVFLCSGCGDEFGILLINPADTDAVILRVSPDHYSFGNIVSGKSGGEVQFTITNTGASDISINLPVLSDTTNYTLNTASPPTATEISSGVSTAFSVTFTPQTVGIKTGTITIAHNAAGRPITINITGTGMPGEIFWTETDKTINCINRDSTGSQILLTAQGTPMDIEIYAPGEQIYWTEYTGSVYQIRSALLNSGSPSTFAEYNSITQHGPSTIAIDPVNGYIYFSVYKSNPYVNDIWRSTLGTFSAVKWKTPNRPYTFGLCLDTVRSNMYFTVNTYWDVILPDAGSGNNGDACYGNYEAAGSGFSTHENSTGPLTDSVPVRDIAADGTNGRIYYVINDSSGMRIMRARYDFQEITVWIPSQTYGIRKIALDLTDRKIYWTTDTGNYIYRADLDTADSDIEQFLSLSTRPNGIAIVP